MLEGIVKYYINGDNPATAVDDGMQAGSEDAVCYRYDFRGNDTSASMLGSFESHSYEAIQMMSGEDTSSDNEEAERAFEITIAGVKIGTILYTDENGKKKKHGVNLELFLRFGAIVRYCKNLCRQDNATDFMGTGDASGEYHPEAETEYSIPQYMGSKCKLGTVVLKLGEIYSMHIESPYFSIHIETHTSDFLLKKVENSVHKGFSFDIYTLGFTKPKEFVQSYSSISGELITDIDEIIKAHKDKDFSWLFGKDYRIVTDDMLDDLYEKFMNVPDNDFIFFDTETSGLNINFKSRTGDADQCVGIILSYEDGISYFFPMQMRTMPNLCGGDHFYFMNKYMRPILEGKKLVAHNLSFDWKVAHIYGINANIVHDTMAMLLLTFCNEKSKFPSALKPATKELLGRDSLELDDFTTSGKWSSSNEFWDLPAEIVRLYACADTDNTRGIFWYIIKNNILQRYNATRIYEIEIRFSYAVAYQEFYGHHIDTETVGTLRDELSVSLNKTKQDMLKLVGHEFNPNSSKQLIEICYKEMGMPEQRDFKTGNLSTSKDSLKTIAAIEDDEGKPMYPFANELLKFRGDEGVRKIVDQFPNTATPDGFIFSSVYQYGTTTGRVSIHEPNYQSYNDIVKQRVVPREGYYMTDTDYSSVEYRVLGSMVGNQMIMEGFKDPDFDYHAYQAARMFNVPYSSVTSAMRKQAKGINFGLPYGMGDSSLGMRIFGKRSNETKLKAKAMREKYFEGQEDILYWFESTRDNAVAKGYSETYFGRRRYYDKSTTNVPTIRRQAGNAAIQGTAADIYKLAVGRLFLRICKEGWLGKVLLIGFIHDEVLAEVHNSIDPAEWLKVLREEFEVKIDGWCPLYMGFGYGMSWYEAKKTELPIQLQWEIVDKYGTTGYPDWDGNGKKFCAKIPGVLRDFYIRHVYNVVSSEDAQGKEINVAINKTLEEVYLDDAKAWHKAYVDCDGDESKMRAVLPDMYVSGFYKDTDGTIPEFLPFTGEKEKKGKVTVDFVSHDFTSNSLLDVFCDVHGYDRSVINVLDIVAVKNTDSSESSKDFNDINSVIFEDTLISAKEQANARILSLGLFVDVEERVITLRILPSKFMAFIRSRCIDADKASSLNTLVYKVKLRDINTGVDYDTNFYVSSADIGEIQELYIRYIQLEKDGVVSTG